MILEADLYYFVAQSEHYGVFSAHPLFDIHNLFDLLCARTFILHLNILNYICRFATGRTVYALILCQSSIILKIRPKVLKQCYFLLKFFWEIKK